MKLSQKQLRTIIESVVNSKKSKNLNEDANDQLVTFDAAAASLVEALVSDLNGEAITGQAFEMWMGLGENEVVIPSRIEDIEDLAAGLAQVVLDNPALRDALQSVLKDMLDNAMQPV